MSFRPKVQSLREALTLSVGNARLRVGDPLARVAFLVASRSNAEQVRRLLGVAGPFIHVDFLTPDGLVSMLGQLALLERGLRPEPSGWLGAWLHQHIPQMVEEGLLGRHGQTLCQPGWRGPLQSAIRELQAGRVDAQMLQAASDEGPVGERLALMADVMARVEQARHAQKYFSQTDLEDSASQQLDADLPCQAIKAVIVLGDGLLPPGVYEVIQAWLARRDVTRIALPPFEKLDPAPWGLRQAVGDTRAIEVTPAFSRLGHLKGMLFSERLVPCAPNDDSVQFVSTPDEVREMSEVARTVQAAIAAGTPLDRIAIALPDNEGAEILASTLRRASIPATWLTAAPLINEPCARFLTLALDLSRGQGNVAGWYDLLTGPGIMGLTRIGRGRWRNLLAGCPRGQGVRGMLDHLLVQQREAQSAEDEPRERAITAVMGAIEHILVSIEAFPVKGSLGEHAAAWRGFMERWWRPNPERERVLQAIDAWGGGGQDVELTLTEAAGLFGEELRSVPYLRGSLTQATVRVLPPMGLLGGAFELVCATGLSEARFPRRPRENPLLTDAMVARLRAQGAMLVTSEQMHEVEKRRFGAIVASCQGTLWLSTPRVEMLEGTPRLPGGLLLDALSCLEGRRVRYKDLPKLMKSQGSRGRPVAARIEDALGAGEHLLVRVVEKPSETLPVLASHPSAHKLLALHRAIDRLRLGQDTVPNAWTGHIPASILTPGFLGGEPLSADELAKLVHDPAGYFWRHVLGAWRPRNLRRPAFNMSAKGIERQALELALEALEHPEGEPEARFEVLWEARVQEAANHLGVTDEVQLNLWRQQGRLASCQFLTEHRTTLSGPAAPVQDATPIASIPLRVTDQGGRVAGQDYVVPWGTVTKTLKPSDQKAFAAMTQGYSLRGMGQPVETLVVVGLDGNTRTLSLGGTEDEFKGLVQHAWDRAQMGWWPVANKNDPFALSGERRTASKMTLDAMTNILGSMGGES